MLGQEQLRGSGCPQFPLILIATLKAQTRYSKDWVKRYMGNILALHSAQICMKDENTATQNRSSFRK